jgi:hypothetical protein
MLCQKLRQKKGKFDTPTVASIESLFEDYNICPASYYGGKLNGVDCREVLGRASELFQPLLPIMLTIPNIDRAPAEIIESVTNLHRDICITLDLISSKMRMKHGAQRESDYDILSKVL